MLKLIAINNRVQKFLNVIQRHSNRLDVMEIELDVSEITESSEEVDHEVLFEVGDVLSL